MGDTTVKTMKPSSLALSLFLLLANKHINIDAFVTPYRPEHFGVFSDRITSIGNIDCQSHPFQLTFSNSLPNCSAPTGTSLYASFLGQDEGNDDASGDDSGGELDDADKYVQKMTPEERRENLIVMKQIFKSDLADLHRRRDYAGWVEAKKDLKKREKADPWFELNTLLKDAVQMDETEEVERLKVLIEKVGGPPPGVQASREYAVISDIYDTSMSLSRAESIANAEQRKKNTEVWKKMIAEREANEAREEEEYLNNPN